MAAHILQFSGLNERERQAAAAMPELGQGDQIDLHVRSGADSDERKLVLPHGAAVLVKAVICHLLRGERVAVLVEDREVSPNDAAAILGMSRPLVVHRMEAGDFSFHHVQASPGQARGRAGVEGEGG